MQNDRDKKQASVPTWLYSGEEASYLEVTLWQHSVWALLYLRESRRLSFLVKILF